MFRFHRGGIFATILLLLCCLQNASAAPVVTNNLIVDLNGDTTGNFLLGTGSNLNKIKSWYDAANDGTSATQQDYGVNTTANMPNLVANFAMPNGVPRNVVEFARNTTNNATSTAALSEWLYSKVGTDDRITDFTSGTFSSGADSAYNVSAISWFTVVRSTSNLDGNSAARQSVFRASVTGGSTAQYGTAYQDDYQGEGPGNSPVAADGDTILELGGNARSLLPGNTNQVNNAGNTTAGNWYIVGNSLNPTAGTFKTTVIQQDGTTILDITNSVTVDGIIQPHALSALGRLVTTSTSALNSLQGNIAEQLVYNSALSGTDMAKVMTYLNEKYFIIPTKTWTSTATNEWTNNENWSSLGAPQSYANVVFRDSASTMNSADLGGASRAVGSLTFNSNQSNFSITGLTTANTLTIDPVTDSTSVPDITVTSGNPVISGSKTLTGADSAATGDMPLGGIKDTDWFVVDIAAGASLDIQASMSSTSSAGRRAHFVKQGDGVLTLSSINQMDMRPQTSGVNGGMYINAGTVQFAAPGARGNPFAPVTVASGAMLEFRDAGYEGSFLGADLGDNGNRSILTISGAGVDGKGAIYNSVGNNRLMSSGNTSGTAAGLLGPGLIVLASDTSIGVASGTTLTLSHGISNFSAYDTAGAVGGSGTAGKLTKVGAGTLIFDANNAADRYQYSNEIIVDGGTFLVNSPTTASARTSVTILGATSLEIPHGETDPSTNGLYIGQPVTITNVQSGSPSIPANTILAGIGDNGRIRLSESSTFVAGDIVDLEFGAVTSALSSSPVTVNNGGTFGGTGSVLGSTITVNSGGTIAPGASAATFTVGGLVMNNGAIGKFELQNTAGAHAAGGGDSDYLDVVGTLDLSNLTTTMTFDIDAVGGGDLTSAGSWTLLSADLINLGGFNIDNITVTGIGGGLTYDLDLLPAGDLTLTTTGGGAAPGDFNGDGHVDAADYVVWRKTMPENTAKYEEWRSHFGASGSGAGASLNGPGAVPEPTTLALLALVLAMCIGRRGVRHC